jgi:hypothetical protein
MKANYPPVEELLRRRGRTRIDFLPNPKSTDEVLRSHLDEVVRSRLNSKFKVWYDLVSDCHLTLLLDYLEGDHLDDSIQYQFSRSDEGFCTKIRGYERCQAWFVDILISGLFTVVVRMHYHESNSVWRFESWALKSYTEKAFKTRDRGPLMKEDLYHALGKKKEPFLHKVFEMTGLDFDRIGLDMPKENI